VTTATTQSPTSADLRFTHDDTTPGVVGGLTYAVWERILPRTWARVPGVLVYRTGRGGRVWRATGTRGAYRTRHAAACAAMAQRSATPAPRDAHDEAWAADVDAAIADPQ
jgi:hypothetical protein